MKENENRVTINDVARLAGVSAQTVSRAFSNTSYIKKETKDKVMECAKELNYVPNSIAKSFRNGSSKKIAIVFDTLKNLYFSILIDYLSAEVFKLGYSLDTYFVGEHRLTCDIYRNIISNGDDGIISLLEVDDDVENLVKQYNLPILIAGRASNSNCINYICSNDFDGGKIAALELIKLKCKNYLYIGEIPGITCSKLRFNGFNSILKDNRITPKEVYTYNDVTKELDILNSSGYEFDGIFCFNDMIAYETRKYLKRLNIKASIIGYDGLFQDIDILSHIRTITINKKNFAKKIAETMIAIVQGDNSKIVHEEIEPFLIK